MYTGELIIQAKPVHDPMVQTWTLEVQRELPGNLALTVGYVGSHGTHLVGDMWPMTDYVHTADKLKYSHSINTPVPITNTTLAKRPKRLRRFGEPIPCHHRSFGCLTRSMPILSRRIHLTETASTTLSRCNSESDFPMG